MLDCISRQHFVEAAWHIVMRCGPREIIVIPEWNVPQLIWCLMRFGQMTNICNGGCSQLVSGPSGSAYASACGLTSQGWPLQNARSANLLIPQNTSSVSQADGRKRGHDRWKKRLVTFHFRGKIGKTVIGFYSQAFFLCWSKDILVFFLLRTKPRRIITQLRLFRTSASILCCGFKWLRLPLKST